MRDLSRSQFIGVLTVVGLVVGMTGYSLLHGRSSGSAPGIEIRNPAGSSTTSSASTQNNSLQAPGTPSASNSPRQVESTTPPSTPVPPPPGLAPTVAVDVTGAVLRPGVYTFSPSARNNDAIIAAGGATANANLSAINLAAHIQDGTQLFVPTREEYPQGRAVPNEVAGTYVAPQNGSSAGSSSFSSDIVRTSGGRTRSSARENKSGKLHIPGEGQVNINTAGPEELQQLPGIGPAMAERLMQYRQEHNGFQNVDDLRHVPGIGRKTFEKLAPFVTVQ